MAETKLFLKHIIRKIFLEDWGVKLAALAITFALWLGVTGLSTPTTQRMSGIPLSLRYSTSTEVTNTPLTEVDIVISGDKRKISQINKNDLIVSVDISDVLPGDRVIALTPENVSLSLPSGVKLDEVLPPRIAVRLEAVEEKEITVEPVTIGAIPEGFELYSETSLPAKVRVRGPASVLKTLTSVPTDKIDLTGHQSDFTARQVALNLAKVTLLDTVVDVAFRIGEKRIERTYSVAVKDSNRRATVVVTGGRSVLDDLKASDMHVELDGTNAPKLILPSGIEDQVKTQIKLR
jgi:YbbR domain-containing protein